MSVLQALTDAIRDSSVEVIDLTAPLVPRRRSSSCRSRSATPARSG